MVIAIDPLCKMFKEEKVTCNMSKKTKNTLSHSKVVWSINFESNLTEWYS